MIATLALLAAPQATVVETVTMDQVSAVPGTNYGLSDHIDESHGTPVRITLSRTIRVETAGAWTNTDSSPVAPFFWITDVLGPNVGDCAVYVELADQIHFQPAAPGQSVDLTASRTYPFSVTVPSTFDPFCFTGWRWTDLVFFRDPGVATGHYGSHGAMNVPGVTIETTIDGAVTFEYVPTPLPQVSVCPGNHPGGAPLSVGGAPERPWFLQSNSPSTIGVVVVSTTASVVVPADGLCITRGGGRVARLTAPAILASGLVQGALPASLSGTTLYFQSWMAGTGGASPTTGECVAVQLP